MRKQRPKTPDRRYFVKDGALRRDTNPSLDDSTRRAAIKQLMRARMAARNVTTTDELAAANAGILAAKTALGEAGPVWWDDGKDDLTGKHPIETEYADWWHNLTDAQPDG